MKIAPATHAAPLPGRPALQQHPHYGAAIRQLGGQTQAFDITDVNHTVARVQVIARKLGPLKLAWVPRGPLWTPNVTEAQKQTAIELLARSIPRPTVRLMTPDTVEDAAMLRQFQHRELTAGQQFARLDLTKPKPERMASQHGKWRNRLRHAQNANVTYQCRPFKPATDQPLLDLELQQRRALRYKSLPAGFVHAWAMANKKAAQLFLANDRDGPIGFVLLLIHAPTATYHIGWSNERGRALSCHNLLLWNASNWLARRGIKELDLGLIDPEETPGLTRFKLGIGAQAHKTGPTMLALPRLHLPKFRNRAA
ncbi:MAG: GNAT family N-acetyltransferase [Roseovarius sp.]|nr:GNAT family N-acetyltransferase [Roseovarius sp.]